jgi:hypothetical protein
MNMNMTKTQLELSFESSLRLQPMPPRNRRLARARWWFQQMHAVVDRAFDWSASPLPPPEQTHLSLAGTGCVSRPVGVVE